LADLVTATVAVKQAQIRHQITLSTLKIEMEAQQTVARMLMENGRRIAEASGQAAARGGIDIYA